MLLRAARRPARASMLGDQEKLCVCMKLQNKTWQRTQPRFAAMEKIKSIKGAIITAATRECTYLGP